MSITTGLIFPIIKFLVFKGLGSWVFLEVLDEGGAKSTSHNIVEVLCQANVNRMLSFAYIVFMTLENTGEYGCGV